MPGELQLINLESAGVFSFEFFPQEMQTQRRATWEPQETAGGTKPLFYGNREPRRITINELWLDKTETDESIGQDIAALFALQDESPKLGRPPALLLMHGDQQQRCVMEEVNVTETWFSEAGEPQRAKVSLTLVELQEDVAPVF